MNERPAIFIFSFNRGGHLQLCVRSALAHAADCRIVVIDDASTDPSTIRVIEALPSRVECVRKERTPHLRHGGLYSNMQAALEMAGDAPFMMFVQDDIQFVRDIEPQDYADIQALCELEPLAFVNTTFLRQRALGSLRLEWDDAQLSYISHNNDVFTTRTYVDVMAVAPARLRTLGWKFGEGELANAIRADRDLGPLRYMPNPVLMNAPRPIAYRGRSRSTVIRALEKLYRYGVYEFAPMSSQAVARLRHRDKAILPVAEDFLSLKGVELPKPWDYDIFESSKLVYPLFHLTTHPVKYVRYQWRKRLTGQSSTEMLF